MPPLARARRLCAVLAVAALAAPAASAADDPVPIWRGAPALGPAGPGALHGGPVAKAPAGAKAPAPDQWIVELAAPPLARYQGGAKGFAPTAPAATGHKLDATSAAARAWSRELSDRQDAALSAVAPSVKPTAEYRTAFAGFAAALTDQQAQALRGRPEVAQVTRERFLHVLDDRAGAQPAAAAAGGGLGGSEAALMGLPNGLWKRLGGPAKAGDGVIVGVVDTGITPESASFADHGMAPPALWDGACEAGDQFPSSTCTNKLVGARYFVDGFGRDNLSQGDYLSPRDEVGHGTHVASIAVGDAGVDPRVDGNPLGVDRITGVAPGAHLAVYKACWEMGYCSNVDVISAIDAAVRDGVDVINLSLGAPHDPSRVDPTEAATLNADAAGVFVAVAAGNAGDYPDAISSPATAPWTTAVAATTASRTFRSTLHLSAGGQSADLPASTTWSGFGAVPLLDARSVAPDYQGDAFNDPRFCVAGLTKEQVQGKVVACEAFAPAEVLVDALRPLGAKGVVLVGGDGLDDPIVHSALPMAVIERHELAALRAVTDAGGGTAQLSAPAARAIGWTADRVASFSSRGPASTTADLLRPDVAAPGVNVLAAYAPNTYEATNGWESHSPFAVLSGTSMASPQVAGAGALLTQLHPTWTPAQLRSALVTTARPATDGDGPASPLAAGAGRIDPTAAADPGLVIAPSTAEYRAFADGTLAPRDLDLPSIQLGDVQGPVSVTRTVTSVASARASWTATVEGGDFSSLDAQVSPRRFTIAPGQSQALSIDLTDAEGARDYRPLTIVLRNGQDGRTVRLPVAMHDPGVTGAPATIAVDGAPADGEQAVSATVAGTVHPVAYGLAAPEVRRGLQTTAPDFPDLQEYTLPVTLDKPTPLLAAKATATDGTALAAGIYRDVDGDGRYTVTDQNDRVSPTSPDPAEWNEADATRLPAGEYLVSVWVPEPHDAPVPFDLRTWRVDDPQPDDPQPAPGLVAGGDVDRVWPAAPRSFPLRWNGVTGGEPLRGLVEWDGAGDGNVLDTSVVRLTPGA